AADRAARQPAADRFGEGHQVGGDSEALGRATGGDGDTGLHLIEDQQRAVSVSEVSKPRQVPIFGKHDPDVHHHRLDDDRRHCGCLNRRASSSATMASSTTGWAKCVPFAARSLIVFTICGCAWPTTITPKPL